jgi:hypothetical protein
MNLPPRTDVAITLARLLDSRLTREGREFLAHASGEIRGGAPARSLTRLLSLASRHARDTHALAPDRDALHALRGGHPACNPEHWSVLDALRIVLLLSSPEREAAGFPAIFEQCFRFADHGEACALYRALPLLPGGARFVARAQEGCRTNMRTVFEAVACDSRYPAEHFDDPAWCQMVIKAIFIDAPLARIESFDARLSPELARMALDLADERRSAGREVPPQLWLCLGPYAGARGLDALRAELRNANEPARRGAAFALARAARTGDAPRAHAAFIEQVRQHGLSAHAFPLPQPIQTRDQP